MRKGRTGTTTYLVKHTLLKRLLLLETDQPAHSWPSSANTKLNRDPSRRNSLVRGVIVLCKDPLAVRVEDEESGDRVEGKI